MEPKHTVFVQELAQRAASWWCGLIYAIALQNTKKLFGYIIIVIIIIQWMPESVNGAFEKPQKSQSRSVEVQCNEYSLPS